jgi:hypothetical protein
MATCRLCNKSGWFLQTSPEKLCSNCELFWESDVEQHGRIIRESVKLIENSKNFRTRLSRISVAMRSCEQLLKYERHGIETIATPPSEAIQKLKNTRQSLAESYVQDELVKARTKSRNAASSTGMVSPFAKVIEKIGELYGEMSDVSKLEILERETREEMDHAHLAGELDKAEKAAFKGQKKKAIDAYLDALFVIKKDSIDDALQQKQITEIESKIRDLGGEIPIYE